MLRARGQRHGLANREFGQSLGAGLARVKGGDALAAAHDGYGVGMALVLVQLVRHQHHRSA